MRPASTGTAPPACGTTSCRFGQRASVPDNRRFAMARVESNGNSIIGRGSPSEICSQHGGDVGWMNTTAARRSSSSNNGSSDASPRYVPRTFVRSTTPSSARSSIATPTSATAATTSGSGRLANAPNRPGWAAIVSAATSFTCRAISRVSATSSPTCTPGDDTDRNAIRTPSRSISSTWAAALHSGSPGMPSGWAWPW